MTFFSILAFLTFSLCVSVSLSLSLCLPSPRRPLSPLSVFVFLSLGGQLFLDSLRLDLIVEYGQEAATFCIVTLVSVLVTDQDPTAFRLVSLSRVLVSHP